MVLCGVQVGTMRGLRGLISALLIGMLMASAGFGTRAQAGERVRDYPARQIAPHTYVIEGPLGYPDVANQGFMNNPAFIVTRTGVVVIDPGSSVQAGRMVVRQIRKVTDQPVTHVLITHVHGDHWLGNQGIREAWPRAELMGGAAMIAQAHASAGQEWVGRMHRATQGFTDGTVPVVPDHVLKDGQTLAIGGLHFRIYVTPNAHSGTDLYVEQVEDSVVFLGDDVTNGRIARMDDGNFKGNIAACDLAIGLKAKHYVPGHGAVGGVDIVRNFRGYLNTLYEEVATHFARGEAAYEMKDAVIAALKPYQQWVGFNEEVGKHISLARLEIEQAEFQ